MKKLKALWAVDAFPSDVKWQQQTIRAARGILEGLSQDITPVYIAQPALRGVFVQDPPELYRESERLARKQLDELLSPFSRDALRKPVILRSPSPALAVMNKTLLQYARENEFDLLVVGTHARRGAPRFFLGSFTEELILQSPLPVLTLNPKSAAKLGKGIRHVLFPTDFSERSEEAFGHALSLAKELEADLLLLHHLQNYPLTMGFPLIVPSAYTDILQEAREQLLVQGESWTERAREEGVRAKFHLSLKGEDACTAILRCSRKLEGCLLIMATQSERGEALLLGSLTRRIVRAADVPVLALHPPRPRVFSRRGEEPKGRALLG